MKRWVAVIGVVVVLACSAEKREENTGMSGQTPSMRADTTHVDTTRTVGDSTMARDTARR